jgi:ComF family protein
MMLGQVLLTLSTEFGQQPPIAATVPLHSSKQRQRGYNQSELVARVALRQFRTAKMEALEFEPKLLARTRPTVSQTGLTRAQRQQNVRGAFTVLRPDLAAGRDILLIDDVFTTGTTARECARVLRQAGAERIFIATVARVFAPESRLEPTQMEVSARTLAAHA